MDAMGDIEDGPELDSATFAAGRSIGAKPPGSGESMTSHGLASAVESIEKLDADEPLASRPIQNANTVTPV